MTSGAGRSCGTGFCLCFLVNLTSRLVRCLILRVFTVSLDAMGARVTPWGGRVV